LIFVAFLFPLGVYCLILGAINRRRHPVMVSAAWDFAGLLFAASGFLAFAVPGFLSSFSEQGRRVAMFGRAPVADEGSWGWCWDLFAGLGSTLFAVGSGPVLVGYFLIVVVGCALILWRRQTETAVYNVHAAAFEDVLGGVLDAASLLWSRAGNRYFIRRARDKQSLPAPEMSVMVREHLPSGEQGRGGYPATAADVEQSSCLEVDPAPALRHVTLRWDAEDVDLRKQVEGELAHALAEVPTHDNPVGSWLLTAGAALLAASVMLFVFAVLVRLTGR
jgi:hypothetical protein